MSLTLVCCLCFCSLFRCCCHRCVASDIYGADYVEAQKLAKKEKEEEEKANQERIKHLKASIVQCGMLGKKGKINPTMKSRYFALVGQSLSYYATEEDVYREDGDEIGSIDLGRTTVEQSERLRERLISLLLFCCSFVLLFVPTTFRHRF